jgi:hypothetical protein
MDALQKSLRKPSAKVGRERLGAELPTRTRRNRKRSAIALPLEARTLEELT